MRRAGGGWCGTPTSSSTSTLPSLASKALGGGSRSAPGSSMALRCVAQYNRTRNRHEAERNRQGSEAPRHVRGGATGVASRRRLPSADCHGDDRRGSYPGRQRSTPRAHGSVPLIGAEIGAIGVLRKPLGAIMCRVTSRSGRRLAKSAANDLRTASLYRLRHQLLHSAWRRRPRPRLGSPAGRSCVRAPRRCLAQKPTTDRPGSAPRQGHPRCAVQRLAGAAPLTYQEGPPRARPHVATGPLRPA